MEHPPLAKQPYANAGPFPLADFRAQLGKQRLDVPPRYVRADGMAEYQGECSSMLAPHNVWYRKTVPHVNGRTIVAKAFPVLAPTLPERRPAGIPYRPASA